MQLDIFRHLYESYPYVKMAWDNDTSNFRSKVIAYVDPDTRAINKLNSIRIQNFNQAIAALPGGHTIHDVQTGNILGVIGDPSRMHREEADYILSNRIIMQAIAGKFDGIANVRVRLALTNIAKGRLISA
jgi:hypothetical protein